MKISEEKNLIPSGYTKNDDYINYNNFYEESKDKIILKKQNSNDNKYYNKNMNVIFFTNYEKLENDNLLKANTIKNLREKLNNQKIAIIEKKEIINELQNINHNLEKELNNLKYKYYYKEKEKNNEYN